MMTATALDWSEGAPLNYRYALLLELEAAKRERARLTTRIAGLEFCLTCPYCESEEAADR